MDQASSSLFCRFGLLRCRKFAITVRALQNDMPALQRRLLKGLHDLQHVISQAPAYAVVLLLMNRLDHIMDAQTPLVLPAFEGGLKQFPFLGARCLRSFTSPLK